MKSWFLLHYNLWLIQMTELLSLQAIRIVQDIHWLSSDRIRAREQHYPLFYLSNKPNFLWVYRRGNTRGMLEEHEKSLLIVSRRRAFYKLFEYSPNIRMGYHAGKPIESVVSCFYKNVSVFYEFTGTINDRFLTNQNGRTILLIYTKNNYADLEGCYPPWPPDNTLLDLHNSSLSYWTSFINCYIYFTIDNKLKFK